MDKNIYKPLALIRSMTGILRDDKAYLLDTLALVNLIVRGMTGFSDWDFVKYTVEKSLGVELESHEYLCPTCMTDFKTLRNAIHCCATQDQINEAIKEEDNDIF